ncbi:exported hypothetical protein [Candidatus Sulfopaludibacter sp. SbA3]|nr:exported hypothetical protein [Candidatus Sulfopaludibacter sp. SbA3]
MIITLSRTVSLMLLAAAALVAAQDRIAGPVDASRTVILKGNIHPRAQVRNDQGRLDPATAISYATLHFQPAAGPRGSPGSWRTSRSQARRIITAG